MLPNPGKKSARQSGKFPIWHAFFFWMGDDQTGQPTLLAG
jgi:hypothetical protein